MVYTEYMPDINEIFEQAHKLNKADKVLIQKAYDFAMRAHEGQKRNSGEPYFIHVFETAKILAGFGMDANTIGAGLLHDTLEDTEITEEEMEKEFGAEIVRLVKGVTKLGKLKYRGAERHVESLRKFFMAVAEDLRVLIIKLADRLHNVRTLQYVREDKRYRIALETIQIHARLADRIGMGKLKGALEDAAFPYVFPEDYAKVEELLKEKSNSNKKELEIVSEDLKKELEKNNIKVIEIDEREKHKYSLWQKLKRYEMDINKIYDIVAIRVIVKDIEDCYRTLGLIHMLWRPMPGRIKDYIAMPKPNGYRSLHTTIFTGNGGIVEIQIRTPEMHAEAAYGVAAHFIYKEESNRKNKKHITDDNMLGPKNLEWLEELKDLEEKKINPEKFLEHLKMDLFKDRIFVLTPKGDVVDLPEDSTIIDFAYAIHSDIGNHAQSAKINGKIATLFTKLHNNDMVEVKVNKKSNPSSKWLDNVKTSLAKKQISSYLKENSLLSRLRSYTKF